MELPSPLLCAQGTQTHRTPAAGQRCMPSHGTDQSLSAAAPESAQQERAQLLCNFITASRPCWQAFPSFSFQSLQEWMQVIKT